MKDILFSLYNVIAKYVMEKNYVSIYEFSAYIGFINILILIIFAIFDYYFSILSEYDEYFNTFNGNELLIIFGVVFTKLGINITTLYTTKYNSPCHIFIIFVFGQMAYYIEFNGINYLVIIILVIILFLSLIFNEIIEINACGLSGNTKRNLFVRAESESYIKTDTIEEDETDDN